jgi:hypothetical protein
MISSDSAVTRATANPVRRTIIVPVTGARSFGSRAMPSAPVTKLPSGAGNSPNRERISGVIVGFISRRRWRSTDAPATGAPSAVFTRTACASFGSTRSSGSTGGSAAAVVP